MIYRFRKIVKDLYRGSAPTPVDVVMLKQKLGINKIISLDQLSGERINSITDLLGINHIMIPINFTKSSLVNLFSYDFKKLFLEGGPVFIHCSAGKDRTGLVSAIIKCKFFGENPYRALMEAKSLGFGIGLDPRILNLYEKLILKCHSNTDSNSADIVSNEREYIDDNRGSILENGPQGSFAPYLDQTKSSPNDFVYNSDLEQSPTRDNIKTIKQFPNEEDVIPIVGLYNNDTGGRGFGPVELLNSFFYD